MLRSIAIFAVFILAAVPASAFPAIAITRIEENNDSVRVYFLPVSGAKDYRAYTLDNPKEVKYAGIAHLFAPEGQHWRNEGDSLVFPYRYVPNDGGRMDALRRIDVPALNIEFNGLEPKVPVKLVVEAMDRVGPSPYSNLANERNMAVSPNSKASNASMSISMAGDAMELLGSNSGPTDDGRYSINGQSGPHVIPQVIARSRPILVTPTGLAPLPSTKDAAQALFDTFGNGAIDEIPGTRDDRKGSVSYIMHTDQAWRLDFLNDDIYHSRPFIMNRHYMDVLFDGGTPKSNLPLHTAHGVMTMSPERAANFTYGRVLHATMEVDAHVDGRRWLAFNISPANDPLTNLYPFNSPINKGNIGFFVQIFGADIVTDLYIHAKHDALAGAAGQALMVTTRPAKFNYDGRGLDNRSRFDLFLARDRYVLFEDGNLVVDQKLPTPLPPMLQNDRIYFTHYLYHTSNELDEVTKYTPYEEFWKTLFPYSDERHWDNMGYEVLPARYAAYTDDALAKLILSGKSVKVEQAVNMPGG